MSLRTLALSLGTARTEAGADDQGRITEVIELERTLADHLVQDANARFRIRVREPICSLSVHAVVSVGRTIRVHATAAER